MWRDNFNDAIGNRTRALRSCSAVTQPENLKRGEEEMGEGKDGREREMRKKEGREQEGKRAEKANQQKH